MSKKEDTIAAIKYRILEEQKKHKQLDWAEIAAHKIYSTLVFQNVIEENTNKIQENEIKESIIATVKDLCACFLYYDRKEDDDLSAEDLEDAVKNGIVTIDEIVEEFRKQLKEHLT